MKNKNLKSILLLVTVVLLALPTAIRAYDISNLGSIGNPLQVQITPSPSQQYDQTMSEWNSRLQQQSLTNSINSASYLQSQQQQTLQAQLRYQQTLQNKVICSASGATLKNGICVSNNQICTDAYGSNSTWSGSRNSAGIPLCGCGSGYVFNFDNTQCVASLATTEEQMCKKLFGTNSYYSNESGHGGCGCKSGYKFTQENSECVSVDTVITSPVSQPISGSGSVSVTPKKEIKKPTITNDVTATTTAMNNVSTSSIVEVKPKSFWQILKGWFGFNK